MLRPPRAAGPVPGTEVVLPVRSAEARPRGVQWVSALLPAMAGVALAWFAGSPQFLLFALLSPVMLLSTSLGDRLHWRRSRRRDAADFRRRLADAQAQVAAGLTAETAARRQADPDPATVARIAGLPSDRLWGRRTGNPDGLHVRLGIGAAPSRLAVREGATTRPAGSLADVPIGVDLRAGPLGVAGPADVVDELAPWLVAQLAVHHSPADLELAFVLDPNRSAAWSWARWLPHLRGRVADSADGWSELAAELTAIVGQRRAARRAAAGEWPGPWLVVVADRGTGLAETPALATALAQGAELGITAVCVDTDAGRLPASCRAVARVRGETGTRLGLDLPGSSAESPVVADRVSPEWAERIARHLAPLVDATGEHGGALPGRCGLLELVGLPDADAGAVVDRWTGSAGGARAVLGAGPDGPVELDLGRDGPHALIAGTTGAGKSELLQTLVGTLAANHPPDELSFLLIDYKGGAAFAECDQLPHSAGLVTDLDPYLTERALRSLDGELRRRERLFAGAGAVDLAGYRAGRPAEPLPRLVIVVDEFAALAEELPDFVRGLVGVAQRGRSLGVHLVLATQRPGSAVSPEIRANTTLRIALRVTDPAESSDVIGAPDAALLDRTTPGRAYLRSGSALTCFQTAHASGHTPPDPGAVSVEALGPWRRRRRADDTGSGAHADTDLARLVDAVAEAARRTGRRAASSPWLPPLPEHFPHEQLGRATRPGLLPLARVDLPDEQRQDVLELDVARGESLLVAGAGRSGRTETLAAVALAAAGRLGPSELALHVVDPAGVLREITAPLPHVATALGGEDLALLPRLLGLLERRCAQPPSDRPAPTLLLLDGWDRIAAALPDADAGTCADLLAQLLRVGPAAGLSVAVTGDRSVLMPRFSAGFRHRVLLRQADRSDFGLVGIPARSVPLRFPPGRGLRGDDGALLQVGHAGPAPGAAAAHAGRIATAWPEPPADREPPGRVVVRPLPTRVRLAELEPEPEGREGAANGLVLGVGGDRRTCVVLDPFAGAGRMLVAGPPRSGRTTALRLLARQAVRAGLRTVLAAPARSPLAGAAAELRLPVITPDERDAGPPPDEPTLLLVDDCEAFADRTAGDQLAGWLRAVDAPLAAVVAGRSDDLATSYRGLGAEARRSHCGVLLRPGPVDGELLGIRLPRHGSSGPPGRGVVVGEPAWGPLFETGEPVPVQVALP